MGYIKQTTYFGDWLGEERPGIGLKQTSTNPIPPQGNGVFINTNEIDWIGEERPWYGNKIENQPLTPSAFTITFTTSPELRYYVPEQASYVASSGLTLVIYCGGNFMLFSDTSDLFGKRWFGMNPSGNFTRNNALNKTSIGWNCGTDIGNGNAGSQNYPRRTLINGKYWPSEGIDDFGGFQTTTTYIYPS